MGEACVWGAIAASSLLVGGAVALRVSFSHRALGLIMAFGAGALLSAAAYELVLEASHAAGGSGVAIGLLAGCLTFFVGDELIARYGGAARKMPHGHDRIDADSDEESPLAIILGIVLDGIPESAVIGLTLVTGGAINPSFIAAVFISNVPEAIAVTTGLRRRGWSAPGVLALWTAMTCASGLVAAAGYVLLADASPEHLAAVLAFGGGAVLTMLANTMMPTAYALGGRAAGILTTLGFAVAFGMQFL